jgi:hypothetical protein
MTESTARSGHWRLSAAVVGLVGVGLALLFAVRVLTAVDGDATIFVGFGEDAAPTREYAEEKLGPLFLRTGQGHDGKYFFVQANDPLLLDPDLNALVLDRPLYRSQRMLYPLLAGAGGALAPEAVVWGLLVTNILALGAGTWATALLSRNMKLSPWWGLAFGLNPGVLSEMVIDGAGIVAAAAAFAAVVLMLKDRVGYAVLLLTLAALSREAMLLAAFGCAWWLWRQQRESRKAVMVAAVPIVGVTLWAFYLRWRIGWDAGVSQVEEIGWPFIGFAEAVETWVGDPLSLGIGFMLLALLLVYAGRAFVSRELVGWAFIGFVALGVLFTEQVWRNYFDITRAVAPIITAFVLLIVASRSGSQRTGVRL